MGFSSRPFYSASGLLAAALLPTAIIQFIISTIRMVFQTGAYLEEEIFKDWQANCKACHTDTDGLDHPLIRDRKIRIDCRHPLQQQHFPLLTRGLLGTSVMSLSNHRDLFDNTDFVHNDANHCHLFSEQR